MAVQYHNLNNVHVLDGNYPILLKIYKSHLMNRFHTVICTCLVFVFNEFNKIVKFLKS